MSFQFPKGWEKSKSGYIFVSHDHLDDFIEACIANGDTPYRNLKGWARDYTSSYPGIYCYKDSNVVHAKVGKPPASFVVFEPDTEQMSNFLDLL